MAPGGSRTALSSTAGARMALPLARHLHFQTTSKSIGGRRETNINSSWTFSRRRIVFTIRVLAAPTLPPPALTHWLAMAPDFLTMTRPPPPSTSHLPTQGSRGEPTGPHPQTPP